MDIRSEIREFLTSRRARLTPSQVGLPDYGTRRVPGLRREEVAVLAGVSVPYYTRLERGNMGGVSDDVLRALARALQLDDAERAHLFDLARAAHPTPAPVPRRRPVKPDARLDLQWLLESITEAAAFIRNSRMDVVAANGLGRALYVDMLSDPGQTVNIVRFVFLDPRARIFYRDWRKSASECVAALRFAAGQDPFDRELTDLIGELCARSGEFSACWASHHVGFHVAALKRLHHTVVGDLDLHFNRLIVPGDDGLSLTTYTAEPETASADGLRLLSSWAATEGIAGALVS
jgi:transcriptional regulator with XRE-family HTH domain